MPEPILDLKEVLDRVQGDQELLLELIEIFLEDSRAKLKEAAAAIKAQDSQALKDLAHALKGASANLSAKGLNAVFVRMEQWAAAGNFDQMAEDLRQVEPLLKELESFAKKFKAL